MLGALFLVAFWYIRPSVFETSEGQEASRFSVYRLGVLRPVAFPVLRRCNLHSYAVMARSRHYIALKSPPRQRSSLPRPKMTPGNASEVSPPYGNTVRWVPEPLTDLFPRVVTPHPPDLYNMTATYNFVFQPGGPGHHSGPRIMRVAGPPSGFCPVLTSLQIWYGGEYGYSPFRSSLSYEPAGRFHHRARVNVRCAILTHKWHVDSTSSPTVSSSQLRGGEVAEIWLHVDLVKREWFKKATRVTSTSENAVPRLVLDAMSGTPPLVLWAHYLFGIFHDMLQSQYGGGRAQLYPSNPPAAAAKELNWTDCGKRECELPEQLFDVRTAAEIQSRKIDYIAEMQPAAVIDCLPVEVFSRILHFALCMAHGPHWWLPLCLRKQRVASVSRRWRDVILNNPPFRSAICVGPGWPSSLTTYACAEVTGSLLWDLSRLSYPHLKRVNIQSNRNFNGEFPTSENTHALEQLVLKYYRLPIMILPSLEKLMTFTLYGVIGHWQLEP
ncbi:hypothetical protein EDC04DRAFT_2615230 [Pisolithus marmoratus]|nr:hypothetical protein EDC04DRAFT_2615230 [Pisolithus marmoratus]